MARDIRRTAVAELFLIFKMTLSEIFSILNNASIRRNLFGLNFRMFTRENKPELQMFFPISGRQNVCGTLCQITRVRNAAQT